MKTLWCLCIAVAACLVFGPLAQADDEAAGGEKAAAAKGRKHRERGRRGRGPVSPEKRLEIMTKALGLDEEQQAKIKEILTGTHEEMQKIVKGNAEARKALRKEMATARENKDREAAKAVMEKMKELRKPATEVQKAGNEKILALLTDEQKEKYKKAMERRRERLGRRGRHGGPRGKRKGKDADAES